MVDGATTILILLLLFTHSTSSWSRECKSATIDDDDDDHAHLFIIPIVPCHDVMCVVRLYRRGPSVNYFMQTFGTDTHKTRMMILRRMPKVIFHSFRNRNDLSFAAMSMGAGNEWTGDIWKKKKLEKKSQTFSRCKSSHMFGQLFRTKKLQQFLI